MKYDDLFPTYYCRFCGGSDPLRGERPEPKREKCCCGESDIVHRTDGPCYHIEQKPDPVEEKIKVIVELHDDGKGHLASLETRLRELVELARKP